MAYTPLLAAVYGEHADCVEALGEAIRAADSASSGLSSMWKAVAGQPDASPGIRYTSPWSSYPALTALGIVPVPPVADIDASLLTLPPDRDIEGRLRAVVDSLNRASAPSTGEVDADKVGSLQNQVNPLNRINSHVRNILAIAKRERGQIEAVARLGEWSEDVMSLAGNMTGLSRETARTVDEMVLDRSYGGPCLPRVVT